MRALFSPPQAAGSRSTVDTDHRWHGGCAGVRACMARPKMAATNLLAAATKRGSCRPGDRPAVGWTSPHLLSQLAGGGRTWRARATGWYWWRPSMQSWCRRRRRPRRRPLLFVGLGWGEGKKGFAVCSGLSVMHALHDACTNARTCTHFSPSCRVTPLTTFLPPLPCWAILHLRPCSRGRAWRERGNCMGWLAMGIPWVWGKGDWDGTDAAVAAGK